MTDGNNKLIHNNTAEFLIFTCQAGEQSIAARDEDETVVLRPHGQTAAEVIYHRADGGKDNMGLTSWKAAPGGKIQKFDMVVAKNYLDESEMAQLQRLVSAYLDVAEDMALRQIPMTMQDWETRLNRFIEMTDREVLQDAGKVTAEIAKAHAESEFEKYRIVQDRLFESDFDRVIKQIKDSNNSDTDEE